METFEQKLVNELKTFQKAFKSTLDCQKYEVNVFECLNKRYIEAGHLIEEYERRQKLQSENGKLPIPRVIKSLPVSKEELPEYLETTLEGRLFLINITFPIANHFKTHPEYLTDLAVEIVGNVL